MVIGHQKGRTTNENVSRNFGMPRPEGYHKALRLMRLADQFQRPIITLIDTHLAALISAAFLFLFGSGPVKGFAVTLVIGLVSNMFTAVFVSRTLFEMVLARKERAETISI